MQNAETFTYAMDFTLARQDLASGAITALAAGDIDGDGIDDLAVVRQSANKVVTVYLNKGDGSFKAAKTILSHDKPITAISIGPLGPPLSSPSNNLVVLDDTSKVTVYQNLSRDTCSLQSTMCVTATANAP